MSKVVAFCALFGWLFATSTSCSSGKPSCDELCNCVPEICVNGKVAGTDLSESVCKQTLEMSKANPTFHCTSGSDASTEGGTEGGGGDGGNEGGPTCTKDLKCAAYCDFYDSTCSPANNGSVDKATCNSLCKALTNNDMANLGTAADTSGDTLGCRLYHTCAASQMDKATHCGHSNIWSVGDTCGTNCDAYCTINLKVCTGANAAFQGMNECLSKCGGWATSGKAGDASGNTLQCREYHLGVASSSDMNAATHCPHTGDVSAVCK